MNTRLIAIAAATIFFAGCTHDLSYKSADFSGEKLYKKGYSTGPQLKENDVLGLRNTRGVTDREINRILDEAGALKIREGSTILLVQSGSSHPDNAMIEALSKRFVVVPHTGLPAELREGADDDTSKALRLAAAHSNAETIVVYWGHLELKRDDLPTGIVSWVPVVDFMVPDEFQRLRMHLKVALVDVRTGNWATFRTEPIESEALTTRHAREHQKAWPLHNSKQRLYENTVRKLLASYVIAKN
jgi:hypothetical protein